MKAGLRALRVIAGLLTILAPAAAGAVLPVPAPVPVLRGEPRLPVATPSAPIRMRSGQPIAAPPSVELTGLPSKYAPTPGPPAGFGRFKDVYVATGDSRAMVRVLRDSGDTKSLDDEHRTLDALAQRGIPVVHVLAQGKVDGHPADVVERYDLSSKDKDFTTRGPALLRTARPDLMRIRQGIEGGVAVKDLQFMVKPGHVAVSDPLAIVTRKEDSSGYDQLRIRNLEFVDTLIKMANSGSAIARKPSARVAPR